MVRFGGLVCEDEVRRSKEDLKILGLNGIDYVEICTEEKVSEENPGLKNDPGFKRDPNYQRYINVYFIRDLFVDPNPDLLKPERYTISGGVRIKEIRVLNVSRVGPHLMVEVDKAGDFSTYTLSIECDCLDPAYAQRSFSFKEGCKSKLDCKPKDTCLQRQLSGPLIDYMAKDYASFRQALIDLIPSLVPDWKERHEADLGMMHLELMAYAGDQLSYYQDSVANEAYLETARQRISVRRHSRLMDYNMHDGSSARAFIYFRVASNVNLLKGTQLLTHIIAPLGKSTKPPGPVIPGNDKNLVDLALDAADAVFETCEDAVLLQGLNEIYIHTWGNSRCCLPQQATTVDLEGDLLDLLHPGDLLLIEEVKGPATGLPEDSDPSHRQIVRLTGLKKMWDPLYTPKGCLRKPDMPKMPITRVWWDKADALRFPLCISAAGKDGTVERASVARGNIVLADHGRMYEDEVHPGPAAPKYDEQRRAYRISLKEGPLSYRVEYEKNVPVKEMLRVDIDPRNTKPQVLKLSVRGPGGSVDFSSVPSLLDCSQFDASFVVETDNAGRATIRFGDGEYGMAPPENSSSVKGIDIAVTYRVGVGRSGNVGPDSIRHVIGSGIDLDGNDEDMPIRNPLPGWGGVDPEPIDRVKQLAPAAFHVDQRRAVTEDDYAKAAERCPGVSKAVASFRWTGSWHTVFIAIDPAGANEVSDDLKQKVKKGVEEQAMAGYDIEIEAPIYVPLQIGVDICVSPDHFRSDVEEALLTSLSNQVLPDGTLGFFHPDRFTFGKGLYLSQLYAAIEAVDGVESAVVTAFNPLGKSAQDEIDKGFIPAGDLKILRLDNDPSLPENGILILNMRGGK